MFLSFSICSVFTPHSAAFLQDFQTETSQRSFVPFEQDSKCGPTKRTHPHKANVAKKKKNQYKNPFTKDVRLTHPFTRRSENSPTRRKTFHFKPRLASKSSVFNHT